MNDVNNLSIALTQLIERDLVIQFHERQEQPSFYNIRATLCSTLENYIKMYSIRQSASPFMLEKMTEDMRKSYFAHEKEKSACMLGKAAMEANIASMWEYKDEHSLIESRTYSFLLLDSNKISENAKIVMDERRNLK